MKTQKEKGSYPKWLDNVDQSYGDPFANVILKLDVLLKTKYVYYIPGSFYNQLLITTASRFQKKRKPINPCRAIEEVILQSLKNSCGQFNMTPAIISANLELSNLINKLQSVLTDTVIMIQLQDSFDELRKYPLNNN